MSSFPKGPSRVPRRLVMIAGLGLAAACADRDPVSVASSKPLTGADALGLPDSVRVEEQGFADLAKEAPSSAGYYYEDDGTLVLRVRDQAEEPAAIRRMVKLRNLDRIANPGSQSNLRGRAALMRAERAEFTFKQLATWRDYASNYILGMPGVRMVDLDERANRVTIGLSPDRMAELSSSVMGMMRAAGADPRAVRFAPVEIRKPYVAKLPLPGLSERHETIIGGIDIGLHDGGHCTLGFTAIRDGVTGFVTASHCSRELFEYDGPNSTITQGGRWIGNESVDPHWYSCGWGGWFSTGRCRGADGSFYAAAPGVDFQVGRIARPNSMNTTGTLDPDKTVGGTFEIVAVDNETLASGTRIDKVGERTGWTTGTVAYTCVDTEVNNGHEIMTMRCAYTGDFWAYYGDSGGPIFSYPNIGADNNRVKLEGTLTGPVSVWGQVYIAFAKASRIRSDLGGTWQITYQGPVEPTPPWIYITGDYSLSVPGEGYWNANMSNYHTPTDCVWSIDGNAIDNGGDCSLSHNFNDTGPGYHILTVQGLDEGAMKISPEFMVQIYNGGCPTCNERKVKKPIRP